MKKLLSIALLLALASCGGGRDAVGVGGGVNVTGSWSTTINISNGSVTCVLTFPMQLTQSGSTFTGTYANGSVDCNGTVQTGAAGNIVNGTLNGSSVTFDVDDANGHQTGTVNGSTMSGTAAWNVSGTALSGTWQAHK
jgi:hypothetical protein